MSASRFRRNIVWSFIAAAARLSANAILFIVVARMYGPKTFGQFTTAHTFATIFGMFADFGFDMLLTTEIAHDANTANHLLPRMSFIKLVLAAGATIAMLSYGAFAGSSAGTRVMMHVFSLYLFFSALLSFMFAMFKGFEELQHEMLITIVINVVLIAGLLVLALMGASIVVVALVFVASRILGLGLAVARGRRFIHNLTPVWDPHWFGAMWKHVSVFGVYFICGNLFFTLDTILLSQWKGDYDVGLYQSVFRIMALLMILSDIAIAALLPTLSRLFQADRTSWTEMGALANRTLYYIGLLIGLVAVPGASLIMRTIYGSGRFDPAIPVFQIFGVIIMVRYAVEIPALMLTTSRQQRVRMVLVVCATFFNLAANAFAIPRYGIRGAAVVSLLTNLAVGLGYVLTARSVFAPRWLTKEVLIPVAVVGGFMVALRAFGGAALVAGIALASVGYVLLVLRVGYTRDERQSFVRAIFGGMSA